MGPSFSPLSVHSRRQRLLPDHFDPHVHALQPEESGLHDWHFRHCADLHNVQGGI